MTKMRDAPGEHLEGDRRADGEAGAERESFVQARAEGWRDDEAQGAAPFNLRSVLPARTLFAGCGRIRETDNDVGKSRLGSLACGRSDIDQWERMKWVRSFCFLNEKQADFEV